MTWRLLAATGLGAAALACAIGLLATSAWLISRAAQHPPVLYLMVAIVAVRAFGLGRGVLRYAERLVSHDAALRVLARARVAVYDRLVTLTPGGLVPERRPQRVGELLELVVSGVEGELDRWLRAVLPMASAAIAAGAAVALEWWLLPPAGLILLGALVLGGLAAPWLAGWACATAGRRAAQTRDELSALTVETLRGLPELVACGAAPARLRTLAELDGTLAEAAGRAAWTAGLGSALTGSACAAAVLGALLTGVQAVRVDRLEVVLLGVVVLVPLAAFEPLGALSAAAQQLMRSRQSTDRVRAVLEAPDPVPDPPQPRPVPVGRGLAVRGLSTCWPGGERITFADFELPAGRRLAILGPSGAGKSTLAAVLLRFLAYDGSVTLGGVELRDLAGDDVRKVIGLCAQDCHLFGSTIAENVRLARPDATDAEIAGVLARAGLTGRAACLDTRVGEHGAAVSGGERRRIALARALLADVPVLILDEPDAHLDDATADAVLSDLLTAAGDRSVLLITHRAEFPGAHPILRHVDQVITL